MKSIFPCKYIVTVSKTRVQFSATNVYTGIIGHACQFVVI